MKYKVGDRVKIKSLDWYNKNKDEYGYVRCIDFLFTPEHSKYCGCEFIVAHITEFQIPSYVMENNGHEWTDEMIEGLVEEEIKQKFKVGDKITNGKVTLTILTLSSDRYIVEDNFGELGTLCFNTQDDWKLVEEETYDFLKTDKPNLPSLNDFMDMLDNEIKLPDGYIFKDENGNVINATKIVLEKKKKEYPKTYEECCEILEDVADCSLSCFACGVLNNLQKLLLCRDAYWKIAGEEMGLGKPWEPDWDAKDNHFYTIHTFNGKIECSATAHRNAVLIFPTAEMRDAFYENFKELIEQCKELL